MRTNSERSRGENAANERGSCSCACMISSGGREASVSALKATARGTVAPRAVGTWGLQADLLGGTVCPARGDIGPCSVAAVARRRGTEPSALTGGAPPHAPPPHATGTPHGRVGAWAPAFGGVDASSGRPITSVACAGSHRRADRAGEMKGVAVRRRWAVEGGLDRELGDRGRRLDGGAGLESACAAVAALAPPCVGPRAPCSTCTRWRPPRCECDRWSARLRAWSADTVGGLDTAVTDGDDDSPATLREDLPSSPALFGDAGPPGDPACMLSAGLRGEPVAAACGPLGSTCASSRIPPWSWGSRGEESMDSTALATPVARISPAVTRCPARLLCVEPGLDGAAAASARCALTGTPMAAAAAASPVLPDRVYAIGEKPPVRGGGGAAEGGTWLACCGRAVQGRPPIRGDTVSGRRASAALTLAAPLDGRTKGLLGGLPPPGSDSLTSRTSTASSPGPRMSVIVARPRGLLEPGRESRPVRGRGVSAGCSPPGTSIAVGSGQEPSRSDALGSGAVAPPRTSPRARAYMRSGMTRKPPPKELRGRGSSSARGRRKRRPGPTVASALRKRAARGWRLSKRTRVDREEAPVTPCRPPCRQRGLRQEARHPARGACAVASPRAPTCRTANPLRAT